MGGSLDETWKGKEGRWELGVNEANVSFGSLPSLLQSSLAQKVTSTSSLGGVSDSLLFQSTLEKIRGYFATIPSFNSGSSSSSRSTFNRRRLTHQNSSSSLSSSPIATTAAVTAVSEQECLANNRKHAGQFNVACFGLLGLVYEQMTRLAHVDRADAAEHYLKAYRNLINLSEQLYRSKESSDKIETLDMWFNKDGLDV